MATPRCAALKQNVLRYLAVTILDHGLCTILRSQNWRGRNSEHTGETRGPYILGGCENTRGPWTMAGRERLGADCRQRDDTHSRSIHVLANPCPIQDNGRCRGAPMPWDLRQSVRGRHGPTKPSTESHPSDEDVAEYVEQASVLPSACADEALVPAIARATPRRATDRSR